jgi:uncharacterized membrane protein
MPEEKRDDNSKITLDVKINTADLSKLDAYQLRALGEYLDQIQRKATVSKEFEAFREELFKKLYRDKMQTACLSVAIMGTGLLATGLTLVVTERNWLTLGGGIMIILALVAGILSWHIFSSLNKT